MNAFYIKYKHVVTIIHYWAILLFTFSIPLSDNILSLSGLLLIITFLLQINLRNRLKEFKHWPLFIALFSYFLLTCIWYFFTDNKTSALASIESKLSLFIFPWLLFLSGEKIKQNLNKLLMAFIIGNIVASLYCYFHTFFTNIYFENGKWFLKISYWAENNHLSFWQLVNMRASTFSYEFLSELKQSSYFATYILFSMCMAIFLFKRKKDKAMNHKILLGSYIVWFTIFLYLLQSRAGLIAYVIIAFLILWIELEILRKKRYLSMGIFVLLLGTGLIFSNKQIQNNFDQIGQIIQNPSKSSIEGENDRFQMWYSAYPIIRDNFWFGVGPANVTNKLIEQYKKNQFDIAVKFRLNAHSQYIESLAGLGIPGLILLLFMIIYCFILSIKKRNYLLFFLIVLLSFDFLFESILNRMAGILFMMFFLSLLVFANIPEFEGNKTKQLVDN